jgi:hypothetical protein
VDCDVGVFPDKRRLGLISIKFVVLKRFLSLQSSALLAFTRKSHHGAYSYLASPLKEAGNAIYDIN